MQRGGTKSSAPIDAGHRRAEIISEALLPNRLSSVGASYDLETASELSSSVDLISLVKGIPMMQTHTTPFVVKADTSRGYRPRISRETRRLLMTACVAVLTLWVLARIRFPDRAGTPNPMPPLLTQLA